MKLPVTEMSSMEYSHSKNYKLKATVETKVFFFFFLLFLGRLFIIMWDGSHDHVIFFSPLFLLVFFQTVQYLENL